MPNGTIRTESPQRRAESPNAGKRLTEPEIEKQNDKLYYESMRKKKQAEEKRLKDLESGAKIANLRKLDRGGEDKLVDKLYTQHLVNKKRMEEKREKELEKANEVGTRKLDENEMTGSINRMYYEEKTRRKVAEQKLLDKYQKPMPTTAIPQARLEEVNKRLYDSQKDRFPKLREELFKKHIAPHEKVFKKIPASDVSEITQRLFTGGK